jgi:mRNA interferase RelE/StbE
VTEYLVTFAATAKKELRDLPSDAIGRVLPRIRELAGNPRPAGCKKLHGYKDRWRFAWETTTWSTRLMTEEEAWI